jgi:probable addiction module antidote protein
MGSKKTSTKQTKSLKKSTSKWVDVGGGVMGKEHSPSEWIKQNGSVMLRGLIEAFADGDKEAFQDILAAMVRSKNITKVAKKAKLSRALIYEAIDHNKNPSLKTMCKIMKAFGSQEAHP